MAIAEALRVAPRVVVVAIFGTLTIASAGGVTIGGATARANQTVHEGQEISLDIPEPVERMITIASKLPPDRLGLAEALLRVVADGVNALRSPDRAMIVITHYQRLLDYIVPDFVHVLSGGLIVRSGGKDLALELEEKGYGWIDQPAGKR